MEISYNLQEFWIFKDLSKAFILWSGVVGD